MNVPAFTALIPRGIALGAILLWSANLPAANPAPAFKVVAFYTARNEPPHISFVREANRWFPEMAAQHNFTYEATTNWHQLNQSFLANYQVVIFLDTRPEGAAERQAFEEYMKRGGAWMGFHFAGFALTPSEYPHNWEWYHDPFLGAGTTLVAAARTGRRAMGCDLDPAHAALAVRRLTDGGRSAATPYLCL